MSALPKQASRTLERFLDSEAYQACLVEHACHTRAWHYDHQTLKVELFPTGRWTVPAGHSWSRNGSYVVTLAQISTHASFLEKVGETRAFEDLLLEGGGVANALVCLLYAQQEAALKDGARGQLAYLRARGRRD